MKHARESTEVFGKVDCRLPESYSFNKTLEKKRSSDAGSCISATRTDLKANSLSRGDKNDTIPWSTLCCLRLWKDKSSHQKIADFEGYRYQLMKMYKERVSAIRICDRQACLTWSLIKVVVGGLKSKKYLRKSLRDQPGTDIFPCDCFRHQIVFWCCQRIQLRKWRIRSLAYVGWRSDAKRHRNASEHRWGTAETRHQRERSAANVNFPARVSCFSYCSALVCLSTGA